MAFTICIVTKKLNLSLKTYVEELGIERHAHYSVLIGYQEAAGLATDFEALGSFVQIVHQKWQGFSKTKNALAMLAPTDWILSLDDDERLDNELLSALKQLEQLPPLTVLRFRRRSYIGSKPVKYGMWGIDIVDRFYNKKAVQWNPEDLVHENLVPIDSTKQIQIDLFKKGMVLHFTADTIQELQAKNKRYAEQFHHTAKFKKLTTTQLFLKRLLAPTSAWFTSYILRLGFLDGRIGWDIAVMMAQYTYEKYKKRD